LTFRKRINSKGKEKYGIGGIFYLLNRERERERESKDEESIVLNYSRRQTGSSSIMQQASPL
jgi:hypothetical protein